MWYLKDFQGNVSGPFDLKELTETLTEPLHKSNASLVRQGEHGSWKPAMLAFPEVYTNDLEETAPAQIHEPDSNPYVPPNSSDQITRSAKGSKKQANKLNAIATDLNRMRVVMATASFCASLLLIAILNRASVQHLEGKPSSLTLGNSMMVCVIFMIFPLSILIKVVRTKTKPTPASIQTTVSLHRRFWSGMCLAATLSVILIMSVLLLN